ncbi:Hypothetical_protein [Hexamita inflata]|uniref:Hypothetical_protein n=1 Tax=Hexamita inflata TaxID=28002 RepID=A0AA86RY64_9EUKA|nr:Hypothetical protein HINF_LOCUS62350 [Hexamita inflata]
MQKFPLLKHLTISPKSACCSELTTPKLANCTVDMLKRNFKLSDIKPLNIKDKDTISAPTLEQASQIIDETFEYDPKQLKQIFNKFVVNVDIDIDLLECSNLIRKSIQSARISSHRLDELLLQITAQSNTMDILCSKQIAMMQTYIEQ